MRAGTASRVVVPASSSPRDPWTVFLRHAGKGTRVASPTSCERVQHPASLKPRRSSPLLHVRAGNSVIVDSNIWLAGI
ncbi:hypothetical protein DY000_02031268 [Brassica cretica]|uniref:Uncharacterized protein n=1 Tax=Brassica cretica TaxID=69181 RepID=A0ABQ7DVH7_BRACR|nr:hypothetical protein DY000_02031268 [Brassica cretica]